MSALNTVTNHIHTHPTDVSFTHGQQPYSQSSNIWKLYTQSPLILTLTQEISALHTFTTHNHTVTAHIHPTDDSFPHGHHLTLSTRSPSYTHPIDVSFTQGHHQHSPKRCQLYKRSPLTLTKDMSDLHTFTTHTHQSDIRFTHGHHLESPPDVSFTNGHYLHSPKRCQLNTCSLITLTKQITALHKVTTHTQPTDISFTHGHYSHPPNRCQLYTRSLLTLTQQMRCQLYLRSPLTLTQQMSSLHTVNTYTHLRNVSFTHGRYLPSTKRWDNIFIHGHHSDSPNRCQFYTRSPLTLIQIMSVLHTVTTHTHPTGVSFTHGHYSH